MNISINEIGRILKEHQKILIFPHINMDGDALGSAVALCKALRTLGKEAFVVLEDDIPDNISFLAKDYCTYDQSILDGHDLSVAVDCGTLGRLPERKDLFLKGKETMCIDHHRTSEGICDYNYIDGDSPATGQIIFKIVKEMGVTGDKEIAAAIFAAITTDTGNFQYSNTNKESHLITAELYDWGLDANEVTVNIYQNERLERIRIESQVVSTLCTICDGRGAIAYVTQDMLNETGAHMSETEECVSILRNIKGVEIAAFIKEMSEEEVKVSLRAKTKGNVAEIAKKYDGGGHTKASGFTIYQGLTESYDIVKNEIVEALKNIEND